MNRPLPEKKRAREGQGLFGTWRAVVAKVDGPAVYVTVDRLTGEGNVGPVEQVPDVGELAVGDRVWVMGIEGRRDVLLVHARRT